MYVVNQWRKYIQIRYETQMFILVREKHNSRVLQLVFYDIAQDDSDNGYDYY